jgi:DNA repair photolyase
MARNNSPDVCFTWSVNPYRGCMHACAYCFARPSHEYLSMGAGTDFETRIVVKPQAPELLREAFERPRWQGETVAFSGVTDCYQPLEASMRLTRRCLEVCAEYRNPVAIITKAPLIERDIDVLQTLSREARLWVSISVPFHNPELARAVEPYVATPKRRFQTIEKLAAAGISVAVSVAPVIPGLNDEDIAKVLASAREAGATRAHYTLLRLPGAVKDVFEERLRAKLPLRAERVLHRIRETRGGQLYDSRFNSRMSGEGLYAQTIERLFDTAARKVGIRMTSVSEGAPTTFRRPERPSAQLSLF